MNEVACKRLGEMAAVIAHEVKNPLAAVRGAIQVIGSRMKGESGDGARSSAGGLDGDNDDGMWQRCPRGW